MIQLCFGFGLVFLMSAFVATFAINPVTLEFTGSRVLQVINLYCWVFAIVIIVGSHEIKSTSLRCRPLFLLYALALISMAWSYNPYLTLRASNVYLASILFGLAMAGRLSPVGALRLVIRTMSLVCLLSIIWVILFPSVAVHQATDPYQFQHAGLWRGVFSHKQGLGVMAGLTTGMLLTYGSLAFAFAPLRYAALACGITCLFGTTSATGFMMAVCTPVAFYVARTITRRPPLARKPALMMLGGALTVVYLAFHYGALNFVMPMLGKSADLTGRADAWPWVIANIKASGQALLGGGFGSGWEEVVAPTVSIDNGYIEMLAQLGYLGTGIVLAVHGWLLWGGIQIMLSTRSADGSIEVFPVVLMVVMLILNITEPTFMDKHVTTIMVAIASYQVVLSRAAAAIPRPAPAGAAPRGAPAAPYRAGVASRFSA